MYLYIKKSATRFRLRLSIIKLCIEIKEIKFATVNVKYSYFYRQTDEYLVLSQNMQLICFF